MEKSLWQSEEARCAVVLCEVFVWLEARDLALSGGVCRAWRRASAAPSLWRRVLLRAGAAPATLVALRDTSGVACWREEAVRALAGWQHERALPVGAPVLHAALAPADGPLVAVALAAADATLSVWQCSAASGACGAWRKRWHFSARRLSAAARVQWARRERRLLLAGPSSFAHHWEVLVVDLHERGDGAAVVSYARCGEGGAACWADAGDAFLSLEPHALAPALAWTTVWLNAATQETHSEYAGVRTLLLRVFNECGERTTHVVVADAPLDAEPDSREVGAEREPPRAPGAEYQCAIAPRAARRASRAVLVAGGGRALGAWPLRTLRPPLLLADAPDELRQRVLRHRERASRQRSPPLVPDAAVVRALCTPPEHAARLPAPLVGLVLHPSARCVWATLRGGAAECRALPTLAALCRVEPPAGPAPAPAPCPAQPDVSQHHVASPADEDCVWVWGARTCEAPRAVPCARAPVAALLPRAAPRVLLLAAGDSLHVSPPHLTHTPHTVPRATRV